MKHTRSSAEWEIREAVVARLRQLMPNSRIIHELNVAGQGSSRIDVAAVAPQALVAVEIKSERDKLDRLADQWTAFNVCCHRVIVAAHEKHFREFRHERAREDVPGELRLNHPLFFEDFWHDEKVWRYPRPEANKWGPTWSLERIGRREMFRRQPKASAMLEMLWGDELRSECARHRLDSHSRRTRGDMILDMAWNMTGREICEAVCRQLRQRTFTEADEPIRQVAA